MNKSKISKAQILQIALTFAKESGIQNLNIRNIARACDVSIGTIYNYFPTKAQLIIAVMEDFWSHACSHEDIKDMRLDNFFKSYPILYVKLYHYLELFEGNWLHQSALLDAHVRKLGREVEHKYFDNIKTMLRLMIAYDQTIRKNIWTDTFTKDAFCEFLFDNTIQQLQKGHAYPHFLLALLKHFML